jgi:hypothetical protein
MLDAAQAAVRRARLRSLAAQDEEAAKQLTQSEESHLHNSRMGRERQADRDAEMARRLDGGGGGSRAPPQGRGTPAADDDATNPFSDSAMLAAAAMPATPPPLPSVPRQLSADYDGNPFATDDSAIEEIEAMSRRTLSATPRVATPSSPAPNTTSKPNTPAAASGGPPGEWPCGKCTFDNPPSNATCEMCGEANPNPVAGNGARAGASSSPHPATINGSPYVLVAITWFVVDV